VRKLPIIAGALAATAAMAASPAAAQDNRRQEARTNNCTEQNPCSESRGRFLWFYVGQDEGQRPTRRVVRRLALDD